MMQVVAVAFVALFGMIFGLLCLACFFPKAHWTGKRACESSTDRDTPKGRDADPGAVPGRSIGRCP